MRTPPHSGVNDPDPLIGLIVPPLAGRVPEDGARLYPHARFIARGLGLRSVTPEGYDGVIDDVVSHAIALRDMGANAISLMGTSLSFYRGAGFNRTITQAMQEASGLPCTSMSHAIINGLRAVGARQVVLATAYIDDVNERLRSFLSEEGIETLACNNLGITGVEEMARVHTDTLVDLCSHALAASPQADAVLLSCGGLLTLDTIPVIERRYGIPVISSSPAGFWDVARLAGMDAASPGHGALFERNGIPSPRNE